LSLRMNPTTFREGSVVCAKAVAESIIKKKTTKYFINWFKTLKVIKQD
jgi:hypothetical protein